MKKSTKIIATVIAVTLVITAMLVAIYAATAGNANITANVSWTAQAGVNLEFWAKATGGDENKEIAKTTITPTTTNTDANIIGDLSCNFTDTTDDGVNNPNAIKFTYYVRNKSLTPLNIRVTKTPAEAEESGTGAENHKPKVTLNSDTEGNNTLTAVSSNAGYDLKAGDIFTYSVTLSLAKGGTGTINADFGLAPNFDAGVTFNFNVGGNSNGTIITSVDGATPTSVSSSTLAGQTLGEYLATQQTAEYSTGWFFDEGLTKVVSDDYLSQSLNDSSLISPIYSKTASITGLVFTLSKDNNSYLVAGESSTSPSGEVVIPNMYNGKPVSKFDGGYSYNPTFKKNTNITSVILPNTITAIPDHTFNSCSNISNVTIPNSVISIGTLAFVSCSTLASVKIPDGMASIGDYAFQNCVGLTNIEISDSVTRIDAYAFGECSKLKSIEIPNSVTNIDQSVFRSCTELTNIIVASGNTKYDSRNNCNAIIETATNRLIQGCKATVIPNTVTSIYSQAFWGCSGLTSIVIPDSVTDINASSFVYCSGLTNIVVASGNSVYDSRDNCNAIIETATNTLFRGCNNTIISNTVKSIGSYAFYGCSELKSIKIPNSVQTICDNTFKACSGLTNLELPNSITSIGNSAFSECTKLTSVVIPGTVKSIGDYAFNECSGLTKIEILNGVTSLGNCAFLGCKSLTKIFIPKSITKITTRYSTSGIFYSCSYALKIYCEASSKPSGWGTYWNYYGNGSSVYQLDVTWGVTRAQFDAL